MTTIDISYEVFLILKPYLPYGTQLTSTYRSPEQQLHEIVRLAQEYNRHVGDGRKLNITGITLNKPNTWVPVLNALRSRYKVNAPVAGHGFPVSPHTKYEVVFDLSGASLSAIVQGCKAAEQLNVIGFKQLLTEPKNNAVHVAVNWVSRQAFERLYAEQGFVHA